MILQYDPHKNGAQYLEDVSTAYWASEALFTALEMDIFEMINSFGIQGSTSEALSQKLDCNAANLERFLELLTSLGFFDRYQSNYSNSLLTRDYLLKDSPLYQGDSILWRKNLADDWDTLKVSLKSGGRVNFLPDDINEEELDQRRKNYILAMDNIAKIKACECMSFFDNLSGAILDVGTGSGAMSLAFLEKFPDTKATLLDIHQVLPHTKEMVEKTSFSDRIDYHPGNILEPDWDLSKKYKLIILSNIVHAYAEVENELVLKNAIRHLSDDGILLIHDFFNEHCPVKAHFSDLNMMLNTYNGKVFSAKWVIDELVKNNLSVTPLIPLKTDTALIFAARSSLVLEELPITPIQKLIHPIKEIGFNDVFEISPSSVIVTEFAKNKCRFGCSSGDKKHCQGNDMSMEETQRLISTYSKALLLKGEPPTGDFQHRILNAEKIAFKAGFYKAFSFWAGPCTICFKCNPDEPCHNTKNRRPSMEGSGIDVFETVRNNGETLETRSDKGEIIKYYGLLLLE